ncbi:hypothetical protein [Thiorhodococcus minor]|uniref:Uncharacterized protein n=1 Tax=Thiorhodococcus minor TaxID=57489 RepID=A0A6M0JVF0_9GAMM|nr:hypothetical protein [Thiorhodococcus minor]NEV61522.1 hypothetical protein [Thiorhodococcus minor]
MRATTATEQSTYTAGSIRILSELDASERFAFARAAELATLYPEWPQAFIARMVEACHLSGWPVELAEQRYLAGDASVLPTREFHACYAELQREARP